MRQEQKSAEDILNDLLLPAIHIEPLKVIYVKSKKVLIS